MVFTLQTGWKRFKQHKLGMFCLLVFALIFLLSLCVEWIANDKPLIVSYQETFYFPVMKTYPETTFGGVFETEADYKDPAVQHMIEQQGWMIWPVIPFSQETANFTLEQPVPSPPTLMNWFGTDDQGRDVLARILYGLRVSLLFGLALTLCSAILGIAIGAIQGYFAGWVDLIGQRIVEIWGALPFLFIVMVMVNIFSPHLFWLFLIMLFFGWTMFVSVVRVEFLKARNLEYVLAARALGQSDTKIIVKHILPNALSSSLSQLPFLLTANITALTTLDFLGYGLPPGTASLGELLLQAKNYLDAPWLAIAGFSSLTIVLTLLIFIGEAARDAFDPKV